MTKCSQSARLLLHNAGLRMKTWPTGMCLNELINRSRLALDHLSSFLKRFVLSIRASFDFFKKVSQMTIKFIVRKLIYLFSLWRIFHDDDAALRRIIVVGVFI